MRALCISKKQKDAHLRTQMYVRTQMGVRALWAFFFCLLPKKKMDKKVFHTKKSTSSVFSSFKKTKKKKKEKKMSTEQQQQPASSPPANRLYVGNIPWSTTVEELQALFADATSVEIPTVRVFVVVFCRCVARFFFYSSGGLSLLEDTKRALPKRATT